MRRLFILLILMFSLTSCSSQEGAEPQGQKSVPEPIQTKEVGLDEETPLVPKPEDLAGELFGVPVPMNNFYFAMRVAVMFGTPWGAIPRNSEQLEERTWNDLLLSYEAFRRNITVSDEELEGEITKNLKGYKVEFDWKADKDAYEQWAKDTLKEPSQLFENQMRHLVQLKKLQEEVLNSFDPVVTDEEAYQEFLNEYNTLSIELVQFDALENAQAFYEKVKADAQAWEKEKAAAADKFKRPGFVALEFLMHMWKLEFKAVYDMIEMEVGSVYPPSPIYKGYGVFKVLEIRRADQAEFDKRKEYYYDQLKQTKRYQGFNEWFTDLKKQAGLKIYAKPPEGIFPEPES